MGKQVYITEEEKEKCRQAAKAFSALEDVDVIVLEAGRYGFVLLKYYTPPAGFEDALTFTDSRALFESLWEEWLHTQLIQSAREMSIRDIAYDDVFRRLPEEKKRELADRKKEFAENAGIVL